jgi:hypothetical protein
VGAVGDLPAGGNYMGGLGGGGAGSLPQVGHRHAEIARLRAALDG